MSLDSVQRFEEVGPRGIRFHLVVGGPQQAPEGDAHGFLVIHDGNQRWGFAHNA